MAGQQEAICGVAVETKCPTFPIEENAALDFQLWFMDSLANLLESATKPKITVSLFKPIDSVTNQVVIVPSEISNLHEVEQSRTFQIRLALYNNDAVIQVSYGHILAMTKIILGAVKVLRGRKNLTYSSRLSIINSGEANLFLAITKTV